VSALRARCVLAATAASLLAAVATGAPGQVIGPDYTSAELACMRDADRVDARAFRQMYGCVVRCIRGFRENANPLGDCVFPFAGATASCLFGEATGVRPRSIAGIVASCTADRPECFVPRVARDVTQWASDELNFTQAAIEFSSPLVFCDDFDRTPAGADQARCSEVVARAAVQVWEGYRRVFGRCKQDEGERLVAVGACGPPSNDRLTAAALQRIVARAVDEIDDACRPGSTRPACHVANGFPDGATWAALTLSAVEPIVLPLVYCGF